MRSPGGRLPTGSGIANGRGLCDTPSDFGRMGSYPSHPQLSGWLALWSCCAAADRSKTLHRKIVTSGTYRQSSAHNPRHAEVDADNRYLWHEPRVDAGKFTTPLRAFRLGGPDDGGKSVRQFIQTPGIHVTPERRLQGLHPDDRRTTAWRSTSFPHLARSPFAGIHSSCADACNNSLPAPSRGHLQALAMLNDKFIVRQSERLARRLAWREEDAPPRLQMLSWRSIAPSDHESQAFVSYAKKLRLAAPAAAAQR